MSTGQFSGNPLRFVLGCPPLSALGCLDSPENAHIFRLTMAHSELQNKGSDVCGVPRSWYLALSRHPRKIDMNRLKAGPGVRGK